MKEFKKSALAFLLIGSGLVYAQKADTYKYTRSVTKFIENEKNVESELKTVSFLIKDVKEKTDFQVRFYAKRYFTTYQTDLKNYVANIPDELILEISKHYTIEAGTKGLVSFDVSDFNVSLPKEGFWVEIVEKGDNKMKFGFHYTQKEDSCYTLPETGWVNHNHNIKRDLEILNKLPWKKDIYTPVLTIM